MNSEFYFLLDIFQRQKALGEKLCPGHTGIEIVMRMADCCENTGTRITV
jgi:hypothetical protein